VIIEKATVSDAEELLGVQKLAYRSEAEIYDDDSLPPLVQTLEGMEGDLKNQHFLKAVMDGRIIGSVRAYAKGGTCYIGRLIVHPDFQSRGLGTRLMNDIERIFCGCKRFELFTGDRSERNLYLYQKRGYRIFKTAKVTDQTNIVFLEKKGDPAGDSLPRQKKHSTKDFSGDLRYKMLKEDRKTKWYLRPISVVLLLFFVLGPFGLPLLYKSPKFGRASKVILTVVVIIYTSYLLFASLEVGRELYKRMEELQELLR
jgi:GNAT superfamily N-acetyltransferase